MKPQLFINNLISILSILLIVASGLSSHLLMDKNILIYGLSTYIVLQIIMVVICTQRITYIVLSLYDLALLLLLYFNKLSPGVALIYIAILISGLFIISYIYRKRNQPLKIISNIKTLSELLMLFLIPFYITIGSGFVIAINQSQILTYIRHTYYGHMEELSINNPQALNYYRQAQEKAQNGLIEEAHQLLSNAIKLENDNAYLHSEMAQIKFSKQHINEGLSHVNKAIELEPDQYRYRGQRAWAFLHEKRLDTLKNELIALRQLTPRNALMHFMWAHLCIENKEFEKACIYADSAKTLCNNYYLSQEIDRFRHNNCGSRRFFNLIKPYDTDMLASSIFYYYKTYQTKANGEPDVENGIPPKGNFTRQEIKQHIKRNYKFFLKQEIEFIYMYENEQNILIVIRGENCSLSKRTLKYIFVEPNLFKNFQLKVI